MRENIRKYMKEIEIVSTVYRYKYRLNCFDQDANAAYSLTHSKKKGEHLVRKRYNEKNGRRPET